MSLGLICLSKEIPIHWSELLLLCHYDHDVFPLTFTPSYILSLTTEIQAGLQLQHWWNWMFILAARRWSFTSTWLEVMMYVMKQRLLCYATPQLAQMLTCGCQYVKMKRVWKCWVECFICRRIPVITVNLNCQKEEITIFKELDHNSLCSSGWLLYLTPRRFVYFIKTGDYGHHWVPATVRAFGPHTAVNHTYSLQSFLSPTVFLNMYYEIQGPGTRC